MRISVASGKGGTGKTLVATNLVRSIKEYPVRLLDCDVEEPNAHLFIKGDRLKESKVYASIPGVKEELCLYCGTCAEVCAFNAIAVFDKAVVTFEDLCHNCGACWHLCPHQCIEPVPREIGVVEESKLNNITLVTGRLKVGSHISPPLIKAVKARCSDHAVNILDGPPGSSCPAMEAVEGSDYCVLVTEPTPFGLNDLRLALEMLKELNVPCGVVINRDGPDSDLIDGFCSRHGIKVLMRIPLSVDIAKSYARGALPADEEAHWQQAFNNLYKAIAEEVHLLERSHSG
ncbi:4Fe-4S binding protein [Desulfofalx alkaliphila]|uniref:nucleotide-binding protein n=1 Tax=Desulfofalx alkaliphila TaxID=105483 RepID=UPI0004E217F1|nr:ATP-binding protein [Desulfofalx alkaliphila]